MFLEFSNNLCAACEPSARVWHEGNYCIGYRSVTKVVTDVYLQARSAFFTREPDSFTHDSGCVHCAAHDKVMSARQNIRSAHTEVEKTLVDGRKLNGAKERNAYLTRRDPQSCHVLSTALGKHLSISAQSDDHLRIMYDRVACWEFQVVPVHLRTSRSNCQTFPIVNRSMTLAIKGASWRGLTTVKAGINETDQDKKEDG